MHSLGNSIGFADSLSADGLAAYPGLGLSRDGSALVFFQPLKNDAEGPGRLVLAPLNVSSNPIVKFLAPDPRFAGFPQFTPDGKGLVYIIREKGAEDLWVQPIDGSQGQQLTRFSSDAMQSYAYSPDGKTLGVMRTKSESDLVLLHDAGSR